MVQIFLKKIQIVMEKVEYFLFAVSCLLFSMYMGDNMFFVTNYTQWVKIQLVKTKNSEGYVIFHL